VGRAIAVLSNDRSLLSISERHRSDLPFPVCFSDRRRLLSERLATKTCEFAGYTPGTKMQVAQRSREQILEMLASFPDEFRRLLSSSHDEEDLYRPGSDGGWGIVEILPHLRDWEEIYLERANRIVEEDHPHIPGYDDSLWPIERDYRGQDPRQVFEEFEQLRSRHLEFLSSLSEESWDRTGDHSLFGVISLHWMENHVCDHDQEHLGQARAVLAG
jgi:hypothetical protein